MDDNTEVEQNESESKLRRIIKKVNIKTAIIIAVVIIVGALGYIYKGLLVAATVNGSPISRFAVIGKLEKTSGKQILNSLVTQTLIVGELDKDKITVTNSEIDTNIKDIENQVIAQGKTLAQVLSEQGMTAADLREQISINLRMEKLFADKTQVSDAEITQYIKDNKTTVPKGQEAQVKDQIASQLKASKFSQAAQTWIDSIRSQASIHYFVNY